MTARPETRIHGREVRVNTGWPPPHLVQKVSICDTNHQVQGRATTGEASEYLKKTLVRDLFVMAYGTRQNSETMSHSVKITALWALKVPLEEVCRFGQHVPGLGANIRRLRSHADNHRRHVSGRRLHAQLSLRDILTMALESRSCHNMIHLLSRIGRTRCRRAVQVLPCQLCHHVFAISDLAQKVVTICMCDKVHMVSLSYKPSISSSTRS